MTQVFKSKVDAWLVIILAVSVAVPFGVVAITLGTAPHSSGVAIAFFVIALVAGVGLPAYIFLGTSYTVTADTLTVRCGPMKRVVPLRSITRITPSRTPMSAPALSLDRLVLEYGLRQQVVISPKEQAGFLRALSDAGVTVRMVPVG